jgi:hypothetical protein
MSSSHSAAARAAQRGDPGSAKRLLTKTLEPLNARLDGRDYMIGVSLRSEF